MEYRGHVVEALVVVRSAGVGADDALDESRELGARLPRRVRGLRHRGEGRERRVSAYPVRPVHVERHLVGVLLREVARASLVDVVAVGGAVHAEREERGPRAGADGVGAQAAAPGELGERGDGDGIRGQHPERG